MSFLLERERERDKVAREVREKAREHTKKWQER